MSRFTFSYEISAEFLQNSVHTVNDFNFVQKSIPGHALLKQE